MPTAISVFTVILVFYSFNRSNLVKKLQLHLFFPTWRFFEKVGPISQFYLRSSSDGIQFDEWIQFDSDFYQLRNFSKIFFNPDENFYLATRSSIDKLMIDIDELKGPKHLISNQVRDLVSYSIVINIAKSLLKTHDLKSKPKFVQFKIGVAWLDRTPIFLEDSFISDVHEVQID